MAIKAVIFGIAVSFFLTGCQSTYKTFNKKIPDKYIEVVSSDPRTDIEAGLKKSGQPYVCKELYFSHNSPKNRHACFIKLPEENQIERLRVRMEGVPQAILLDTGKNIVIVGHVFLELLFSGNIYLIR